MFSVTGDGMDEGYNQSQRVKNGIPLKRCSMDRFDEIRVIIFIPAHRHPTGEWDLPSELQWRLEVVRDPWLIAISNPQVDFQGFPVSQKLDVFFQK